MDDGLGLLKKSVEDGLLLLVLFLFFCSSSSAILASLALTIDLSSSMVRESLSMICA
jgi:hypothetical protein